MFCRLGGVLIRKVNEVTERHDLRSIPIIEKISFGGVISVTDPDEREDYRGRLFWAEAGELIYSKIRAKQGSLGIVPPEMGRLAVSAEYPVYQPIEEKIVPAYLTLLLKCPSFLRFLDGIASGGDTKTRIAPDLFETLQIALPPLATQRAIVGHWQATQDRNAAALKAADNQEAIIQQKFLESLGLGTSTQPTNQRAFALRWTEVERWGVDQARRLSQAQDPKAGKFPVVKLRDVIANLQNGWSPQCFDRPAVDNEWGVLK
jgi:type I restriction enzyme S subunit